jgi:hypothetical protein
MDPAERPTPDEEREASREPLLPAERSLEDFPVGTEVVAYIMNYGNRELRRAVVEAHTEHGSVVVKPETAGRGQSWGKSPLGSYDSLLPKLLPHSPGLLRLEDVEALQTSPEYIAAWVEKGDTYKDSERRRLADKIRIYSGYEGPPARVSEPAVRERSKGIRKFSSGGNNA